MRKEFEILSEDALGELEPKLIPLFKVILDQLGPGQAFLQLISGLSSEGETFMLHHPYSRLWLNDKGLRVEVLRPDGIMGLTRWAAQYDRIIIYPTDPVSQEHYVQADERVQTEIVGPIHFKGKVTGVVLYDRVDEGRIYGEEERRIFEGFLHQIDYEIRKNIERHTEESQVAAELTEIINNCYKETLSARGYIAIKRWDGLLEYFKAGEGTELFLELAPHEGLCGKVLRTGKMVNVRKKLFSESHYIPSDTEIRSEIVCPIKLGSETIGVINLESKSTNAYDTEVESFLEKKAALAAPSAKFYRNLSDPEIGLAITDLFQTSLWIRPPESQRELEMIIRETLRRWLMRLLKARRSSFWLDKDDPQPAFLPKMSWEEAVKGSPEPDSSGPSTTLFAPVLMQGEPLFVVALELGRERISRDQNTVKALCAIASEFLRRARYEYRIRRFIKLTDRLVSEFDSEAVIEQAVSDTPAILQSNHCTLFYLLRYDGKDIFVPGPSTADEIHFKGQYPGYSPTLTDGLTGFVAQKGEGLRIDDVRDKDELEEIDANLVWKSRVSEEVEWDCRSFLAYPIFDSSDPRRVIGVIRTHRDAKSHRSGFTDENDRMFKTISHLLSRPLTSFLQKKTALHKYSEEAAHSEKILTP